MLKRMIKGRFSSLVTKVTTWYSILLLVLFSLLTVGTFFISGYLSEWQAENALREQVTSMSYDVEDFEDFDEGIYFAHYLDVTDIKRGHLPKSFDSSLPFSEERIQEVSLSGVSFQYFDARVADGLGWIRGIRIKEKVSKEWLLILVSLVIILPLFFLLLIIGGYRILKKSLSPIEEMRIAALDITKNQDYSRRILEPDLNDEIGRLAHTFNTMLSSIESGFEREKNFTTNASHELRTPIAIIMAESEYGAKYATSIEEAKESHEIVHRQSKRMRLMVEQLLDLARLNDTRTVILEPMDFSKLLERWLKDRGHHFIGKKVTLSSQIQPECWVRGDEYLLEELFDNLLSNALKFTKDMIAISLSISDNNILLTITDNGSGIPEKELDKVWDKFYQVNSSRTKSSEVGVGLGLSLVADIVRRHKASYDLSSRLGLGTSVSITFEQYESSVKED